MAFIGASDADSWPVNATYDREAGSRYRRIKMCSTFVNMLQTLGDPRLGVWAKKVECFLLVDDTKPAGTGNVYQPRDTIVNGEPRKVRYISPDVLASRGLTPADIDQDQDYVGLPPALAGPAVYNMSNDAAQASTNAHVSWLNDIYKEAKGPLLKARFISAAEVHFILAEAALKGWAAGDAETHYRKGIEASFMAWGVTAKLAAYLAGPVGTFQGTQQQIIEQKWIAAWTNATEAWADYKRTGFPVLKAGPNAKGPVVPVRFYYMLDERNLNNTNIMAAAAKLEITNYSAFGANGPQNSPGPNPGSSAEPASPGNETRKFQCIMRYSMLKTLTSFLVLLLAAGAARAQVTPENALRSYLDNNDKSFRWTVRDSFEVADITAYSVALTSQQWREHTWKHQLMVFVPKQVKHNGALLFITGGSLKDGEPRWTGANDKLYQAIGQIAHDRQAITAVLRQTPNQPLYNDLTEDALISYTLHNFKQSKDYTGHCCSLW